MSTVIAVLTALCRIPTLFFLCGLFTFVYYLSGKSWTIFIALSWAILFILPVAIGVVFFFKTLSGPENPQTYREKTLLARIRFAQATANIMFQPYILILMFSCYAMLLVPIAVSPATKMNTWIPMSLLFLFGLYAPWAYYKFGINKPVYDAPPRPETPIAWND